MAKVLVLDSPLMLSILAASLELDDHQVQATSEPAIAQDVLAHDQFDLIITNLKKSPRSPEAREALELLSQAARGTPILLTTSFSQLDESDLRCYGVAAIITKPFGIDELLARVRGVLDVNSGRTTERLAIVDTTGDPDVAATR